MLGNFAQVPMLLPMILGEEKPPLRSSFPLTLSLAGFTYAFFSLGLVLSGVAMASVAACWAVLVAQRAAGFQVQDLRDGFTEPKDRPNGYYFSPAIGNYRVVVWRRF